MWRREHLNSRMCILHYVDLSRETTISKTHPHVCFKSSYYHTIISLYFLWRSKPERNKKTLPQFSLLSVNPSHIPKRLVMTYQPRETLCNQSPAIKLIVMRFNIIFSLEYMKLTIKRLSTKRRSAKLPKEHSPETLIRESRTTEQSSWPTVDEHPGTCD